MAPRKGERQRDLESPEHLGMEGNFEGGTSGGGIARDTASEDDLKRAFERPAGATRVHKANEEPSRPRPRKPVR